MLDARADPPARQRTGRTHNLAQRAKRADRAATRRAGRGRRPFPDYHPHGDSEALERLPRDGAPLEEVLAFCA